MKLRSIRVRSYRCVEDSEEFTVGDVTCLVGKNESGKTTLLRALMKLNPANAQDARFVELDYPRKKWIVSEPLPLEPPPIWSKWQLIPDEVASVEAPFAPGVLKEHDFVATRSYDNVLRCSIRLDETPLVARLMTPA